MSNGIQLGQLGTGAMLANNAGRLIIANDAGNGLSPALAQDVVDALNLGTPVAVPTAAAVVGPDFNFAQGTVAGNVYLLVRFRGAIIAYIDSSGNFRTGAPT